MDESEALDDDEEDEELDELSELLLDELLTDVEPSASSEAFLQIGKKQASKERTNSDSRC